MNRRVLLGILAVVAILLSAWGIWQVLNPPPPPDPTPAVVHAIQNTDNAVAVAHATAQAIKENRPKHDQEVQEAREEAIQAVSGLDPRAVADRLNAHLARFRADPLYPSGDKDP